MITILALDSSRGYFRIITSVMHIRSWDKKIGQFIYEELSLLDLKRADKHV